MRKLYCKMIVCWWFLFNRSNYTYFKNVCKLKKCVDERVRLHRQVKKYRQRYEHHLETLKSMFFFWK